MVNGYQVDVPTYTTLQVSIIKGNRTLIKGDSALIKGDLPTCHTNNLKRVKAYEERSTKVTPLSISHF